MFLEILLIPIATFLSILIPVGLVMHLKKKNQKLADHPFAIGLICLLMVMPIYIWEYYQN